MLRPASTAYDWIVVLVIKGIADKYEAMTKTSKAALWFALCNCFSSGVSFLSMPFFTRLMTADQYGVVTVYNSWLQVFSVFATLNLAAGAFNNGMVKFSEDRDGYSSAMQGLLVLTTLCSGFAFALIYFFAPFMFDLPVPFVVVMLFQVFSNGIYACWCARQRYEYKYHELLAMTFVFAVVVTGLAVLAVAFTPNNSLKAIVKVVTSACGALIVALLLIIFTQKKTVRPFDGAYWNFALRFSLPLIPHYLSLIVLGQIDRIMISNMVGPREAAFYAVSYTIGTAMSIVSSALNSSMVPWQFEKIKRANYDGLASKATSTIALLSLMGFGVALISPEILVVAAPGEYQEAVVVMPAVVMSMVFTFIYNILSNYEFYYMENKFISVASTLAAVANLILNYLMIPVFGYLAAGYSTVICYGMLAIVHTIFSWKVCVKNAGLDNARKMIRPKAIWVVAGIATVLTLCCNLLYPYPLLRYSLALVLLIAAFFSKNRLAVLLGR